MTIAVALLVHAVLLSLVVAPALHRHRVLDRAPRLGIVAWPVLVVSAVLALVLGGLALPVSTVPVSSGLAEFLQACVVALRSRYATPASSVLGALGASLALAALVRVGYHLLRAARTARRRRVVHRDTLALTGRQGPWNTTLLDHSAPAAYCVPGRDRRVVLTTGALEALDTEQLRAVLAHEHAHLRGRHHLVVMLTSALADAFPRSRTARTARAETARLVELAADDAAVRRTGRLPLAEALLALNPGPGAAATLSAGGTTAAARVRRLIEATPPVRCLPLVTGVVLTGLTLVLPLAVAAGPALAAIGVEHCPIGPDGCLWQDTR